MEDELDFCGHARFEPGVLFVDGDDQLKDVDVGRAGLGGGHGRDVGYGAVEDRPGEGFEADEGPLADAHALNVHFADEAQHLHLAHVRDVEQRAAAPNLVADRDFALLVGARFPDFAIDHNTRFGRIDAGALVVAPRPFVALLPAGDVQFVFAKIHAVDHFLGHGLLPRFRYGAPGLGQIDASLLLFNGGGELLALLVERGELELGLLLLDLTLDVGEALPVPSLGLGQV